MGIFSIYDTLNKNKFCGKNIIIADILCIPSINPFSLVANILSLVDPTP